jgi:hypothetical protein
MGQPIKQDMAILDEEWILSPSTCYWTAKLGAYSVIAFCGSFWGNEVFCINLSGLKQFHPSFQIP